MLHLSIHQVTQRHVGKGQVACTRLEDLVAEAICQHTDGVCMPRI